MTANTDRSFSFRALSRSHRLFLGVFFQMRRKITTTIALEVMLTWRVCTCCSVSIMNRHILIIGATPSCILIGFRDIFFPCIIFSLKKIINTTKTLSIIYLFAHYSNKILLHFALPQTYFKRYQSQRKHNLPISTRSNFVY